MSIQILLGIGTLLFLLSGCHHTEPTLKAPCDYHATFCGQKIKVNSNHEL